MSRFLLTAVLSCITAVHAQVTSSLGDLEPGFTIRSSAPTEFAEGGGILFVSANLPVIGQELVAIELATGAVTVIDIYQSGWSQPWNLVYHAGHVWFTAVDGVNGRRALYMSDGTLAGTRAVPMPGATAGALVGEIAPFGNSVVFDGDDGVMGSEPWIVDTAGTNPQRLADIMTGPEDSSPSEFVEFQGRLYFRACDSTRGCSLWSTDGTAAGTTSAIAGSASHSVSDLVVVNNRLILSESNLGAGREPYWLNGDQLQLLADTRPGTSGGGRLDLRAAIGNQVVFQGDRALWVTDGSVAGTNPVPAGVAPWALHPTGNQALFWSFGSTELWVTDGTAAGTQQIFDLDPGSGAARLTQGDTAALPGGRAVFSLDDGTNNHSELWVSDGTAGGTALLYSTSDPMAVRPRFFYRSPSSGRVFFYATSATEGTEVWETDGTVNGTRVFANLASEVPLGSDPQDACDLLDRTLFSAWTQAAGRELWVTDGTAAGTSMLLDVEPGSVGSNPSEMTRIGNLVVFAATTSSNGRELWVSDGTQGGTQVLADLSAGPFNSNPEGLSLVDGEVWFSASDPMAKIWRTDGTATGTVAITTGSPPIAGTDFTRVGTNVFFAELAPNVITGIERGELWVTDGTAAGTKMVVDIYPGSYLCYPFTCINQSSPQDLVAWNGLLWFLADDGVHGREIWVSDGTATGTVIAVDHSTMGIINEMTLYQDRLWFSAYEPATGHELWVSDGSSAGTTLFADLQPGTGSSYPSRFARVGTETLLFAADDGTNGREFWLTDGTIAGTRIAADLQPGAGSSAGGVLDNSIGRRSGDTHAALGHFGGALILADDGAIGSEPHLLDVGGIATPIHPGGALGAGTVPTFATGDPRIGQSVSLQGNAPVVGSTAIVAIGSPAPAVRSLVAQPLYLNLTLPVLAVATIPMAGSWQTSVAIPNDVSLAGAAALLQTLTVPSSAGPFFDVSNGVFWVLDF